MKEFVRDRNGNIIYLTMERWEHITKFHPEMINYRKQLLFTIKKGQRKQDSLDHSLYIYYHPFKSLERGFNHIVAIVKFGLNYQSNPNNFILTAYQKFFEYFRS